MEQKWVGSGTLFRQQRDLQNRQSYVKNRKEVRYFFGLVFIILAIVFIYTASQDPAKNTDNLNTFSNQPAASPTKESRGPLIKIINGTGQSEETDAVFKIITGLGFKVTKTENALNLYDNTIVYYDQNYEKNAQEIAQGLSDYNAKPQKFSQETPYDIIIVIGSQ